MVNIYHLSSCENFLFLSTVSYLIGAARPVRWTARSSANGRQSANEEAELIFPFSKKTEKHLTAFESSFVGHIFGLHRKEDDTTVHKNLRITSKDNEFYEIEKETPPLKDSILRNDF